jgi:hypothetical protein
LQRLADADVVTKISPEIGWPPRLYPAIPNAHEASRAVLSEARPLPLEKPMQPENTRLNLVSGNGPATRNPFGVMDVPHPNDDGVMQYARITMPEESATDENAKPWSAGDASYPHGTIEGKWSSRWNGAADPTIPGDAPNKWKQGRGEARIVEDRVYLLFDWDAGARRGLIDARREGPRRLVGKYINLNNPEITVPWVGLVVSDERIDGYFALGRVDFRR